MNPEIITIISWGLHERLGMFNPCHWVCQYTLKISESFSLEYALECLNLRPTAHELGEQPTVFTPGFAERYEGGAIFPAYEAASHHERRAIAIDATLFG